LNQYDTILIIGSGGREHSIGWKLLHDRKKKVFFAPGNGGTDNNIEIDSNDLMKLCQFAKENNSFTIVGPEKPLSLGIVDIFENNQLPIFGPSKSASRLESVKYSQNFSCVTWEFKRLLFQSFQMPMRR
jgi:phosphoribosylamine--glycine ligase